MEIKVLCQFPRKRLSVGILKYDDSEFTFAYDLAWLNYKYNLPLGPDLPLHTKEYRSATLFQSFARRIPPRNSENYARYAKDCGISINEKDPMILLGTVAHMGASSFVFELDYSQERQEYVLVNIQRLVDSLSFEIVAAGFGVNKTGLFKLLKKAVQPENSNIYDLLEVCFFNRQAGVWKIKQSLLAPDNMKHKLTKAFLTVLDENPFRRET